MSITTVVTQAPRFRTVVSARGHSVEVTPARAQIAVMQVGPGLAGAASALAAPAQAQISADTGNQLVQGSDQRLFVPNAQAVADPLAYYILASN